MNLMYQLSKLKIKCPRPVKSINGKYLIKLKNKNACIVSFFMEKIKKLYLQKIATLLEKI